MAPQNLALDTSTSSATGIPLTWLAPTDLTDRMVLGCLLGYRIEWWNESDPNHEHDFQYQDVYLTSITSRLVPPCATYTNSSNSSSTSSSNSTSSRRRRRSTDEALRHVNLLSQRSRVRRALVRTRRQTAAAGPLVVPGQRFSAILYNAPGNVTISITVRLITLGYAGPRSNAIQINTPPLRM